MASDSNHDQGMPVRDAFEMLSDQTRLDIIEALYREREPMAYSALMEAVDAVDSGRFNYHLDQLTGPFVESLDDGYQLRFGAYVVQNAVDSGAFNESPTVPPAGIDATCPECDSQLRTQYDDGAFRVDCTSCDAVLSNWEFPPQGVAVRERGELEQAYETQSRYRIAMGIRGVCPYCGGRMEPELQQGAAHIYETLAYCECTDCNGTIHASTSAVLLCYPSVIGFLHDRGVDIDQPPWRLDCLRPPAAVTTSSENPPRVDIVLKVDDDQLELTLDDRLNVTSERIINQR